MWGTRRSGVVSSAVDMLEMSVLGEWARGLGLGFTNPVGTRRVWDMCMCLGYG